jgi:hypothetical protein
VETPPETPPQTTPPETTPPVETPPETTPPETYTPPETPVTHKPSSPNETPKPNTPPGAGGVLGLEQGSGGGGVVEAAPSAQATLPFTGAELPLLFLTGAVLLGLGLVLHRVSSERA